jgi:SAM-dependent methyltransferase
MIVLYILVAIVLFFKITNLIVYGWMKHSVVRRRRWDLNICCGKTDGGGVNADIVEHTDLPNYFQINDVTNLPFRDKQFKYVLCSHTIEHVDEPEGFYRELNRVGENVTILIPPLWDITAAFNVLEHKWLFLTFKHKHTSLPPYIPLPLSRWWQNRAGQKVKA